MKKDNKIKVETIKARDMKRGSQTIAGEVLQGCHAEIVPGESIRVFGDYRGRYFPFDKTFKIGDTAEYDSYNMSYTGAIVNIGAKTVTIQKGDGTRTCRLSLYDFCWRNHDLDLDRIAERNHDVLMHC